jgi:lactate permease
LQFSFVKGWTTAFDILLIIVGALFFLNLLRQHQILHHLILYLESFSADYRIQTILLAWFFENFLEGIAGFGTPSTVVAPILVTLGISPFVAVVLSLLGNSISVAFGAASTPINVGFYGLDLPGLSTQTVVYSWPCLIIPVLMLFVVVRFRQRPLSDFISALPFALWSGFTYIFSTLIVSLFNQNLITILGSVLSFLIIILSIKFNLFVPRSTIKISRLKIPNLKPATITKVFSPYIVLIASILLLHTNPGISFLITSFLFCLIWQESLKSLLSHLKPAITSAFEPFLIILLMSTLVQILSSSGMLSTLLIPVETLGIKILSPIIGAFGSFITGSATISNILFGQLLFQSSQNIGLNPVFILALQLVGASLGNMVALADMVAAETVVGLKNQESQLIKTILPYCLFVVALVILFGNILINQQK